MNTPVRRAVRGAMSLCRSMLIDTYEHLVREATFQVASNLLLPVLRNV